MKLIIALAISLIASGCLEAEELEVRVLREQGEPAVLVIEESNFYSDETDPAKIKQDFDTLINRWRGEQHVRDMASEGFFVKGRELFLRDGKIVFRQTGVVFNLNMMAPEVRAGESITLELGQGSMTVLETNGKKLEAEGLTLSWPRDAKELRIRVRMDISEGKQASQPQLVQLLSEYLATH